MRLYLLFFALALFCATIEPLLARSVDFPFSDVAVPNPAAINSSNDWIVPRTYRALQLDHDTMRMLLGLAPLEVPGNPSVGSEIVLPMPDGTNQRFHYYESSIMDPALQSQFPEIRTYVGRGLDDGTATLRMDLTPGGFHAQILSASGSVYIDPRTRDLSIYASYYKRDAAKMSDWSCGVTGDYLTRTRYRDVVPAVALGTELRTYRLACAATAEYTAFHTNATKALAAIVTAFNRVNGVYEREVAVRFNLVANNNLLIFTNTATDGYTNDDGEAMLSQNQTKIDSVIGSANYDIGHVFSTGGGGIASLGSVCDNSFKAQGVTGSSQPIGDPFYIDYVCHEVGHQFNANHTFNSETGSCGGGNRSASTAYEVGSGSTILAYAGICSPNNVQNYSDDYFHAGSLSEISAFITSPSHACPSETSTGNSIPTVTGGADYIIPRGTPFVLTAIGGDVNGDTLTYCWEQMDLGPAATLGAVDSGSGPLFRSFLPSTNNWRTFPALSNVLANTTNIAERLPNTSRIMNFRVTVRDNRAGGGGHNMDDVVITVSTNGEPFTVTNFNTTGVFSGLVTVGWNVAGTTSAPISASHVKIMLSTNGGNSFPITLTPSTPNTGSASVLLPNISNNSARIMVQAAQNIFFDINNTNISIRPSSLSTALMQLASSTLIAENCVPTNGAPDPGETVSMQFVIGNYGNAVASNVVGSLLTTNGVLLPGPAAGFGTISPGSLATQVFSFTAGGSCGSVINPTVRLSSDTHTVGSFFAGVSIGSPGVATNFTTNASPITIRDNNTAVPYPSTITVANAQGNISKVTVTLRGLSHGKVYDINALLVGPNGQKVILMGYCAENAIVNATLTFDDAAAEGLPYTGSVSSGTYKPTSFLASTNALPSPAPLPPYGLSLSAYNGISPNGNWVLYMNDSGAGSTGIVASGWSIRYDTTTTICCDAEPPPPELQASTTPDESASIVLRGAAGLPYATNYLHVTTNLLIPPANWSRVGTNIADVNGFFGFTNTPDATRTQFYYMIQSPP